MKKIVMITGLISLLENGIKQVKSVHKEEKDYVFNCSVVKFVNSNLKYLNIASYHNGIQVTTDNYGGLYLKEVSDNLFDLVETVKISSLKKLKKDNVLFISPDTYCKKRTDTGTYGSLNLETLEFVESIFIKKIKSDNNSITGYLFKNKNTNEEFEIFKSSDANIFVENGEYLFN